MIYELHESFNTALEAVQWVNTQAAQNRQRLLTFAEIIHTPEDVEPYMVVVEFRETML